MLSLLPEDQWAFTQTNLQSRGICRDSPEELNLDPTAPEVRDAIETAKKLSGDA